MSQPPAPLAVVIPAQPLRLQLGERTVLVPTEPLAHESQSRRAVDLSADGPDCLVLMARPQSTRSRWAGRMVLAMVAVSNATVMAILGFLVISALLQGGWWLVAVVPCLLLGLLFLYFFVLLLKERLFGKGPRRLRFDRRANQLIIDHPAGFRGEYQLDGTYPLSDIVAVQMLDGGYHHHSHSSEHGPISDERFHSYEMNLLVDRAEQPRLHLTAHADWQWMQQEGQKLANFLGIPAVDQLSRGS